MGCGNCSSGGCGSDGLPAGCKNNGNCSTGGCNKLDVFDYLTGMERTMNPDDYSYVEVRFKNTRKEFFKIPTNIELHTGDLVVVTASHGYDLGMISLSGPLVSIQMNKKKTRKSRDLEHVKRKANQEDIDLWNEAKSREKETLLKARNIVTELKLDMKVSDVEFQGDNTKAMFYYTSESRVDFRELIKVLAGTFKVRVEMKQIGSRQEAGLVGGIGSCGRELCCSTWLTDFRSVSTSAARYQQLSINPVKLAGQCGKLKCCLNYELDAYMDAFSNFPNTTKKLQTKAGYAFHQKTDVFKGILWYALEDSPGDFVPLTVENVQKVLAMNEQGKKVDSLKSLAVQEVVEVLPDYENVVGQDSLTRFDKAKKKRPKGRRNNKRNHRNRGKKNNNA